MLQGETRILEFFCDLSKLKKELNFAEARSPQEEEFPKFSSMVATHPHCKTEHTYSPIKIAAEKVLNNETAPHVKGRAASSLRGAPFNQTDSPSLLSRQGMVPPLCCNLFVSRPSKVPSIENKY